MTASTGRAAQPSRPRLTRSLNLTFSSAPSMVARAACLPVPRLRWGRLRRRKSPAPIARAATHFPARSRATTRVCAPHGVERTACSILHQRRSSRQDWGRKVYPFEPI